MTDENNNDIVVDLEQHIQWKDLEQQIQWNEGHRIVELGMS